MKVDQNERVLGITTKYFNLRYVKEKSFTGDRFAPNANFHIKLLDTNKEWYFGHPEARNMYGIDANIDTTEDPFIDKEEANNFKKTKAKIEEFFYKPKGLYSEDGFVSFDDSKSNFIGPEGEIIFNDHNRIDTYVFLYNKDFGNCLQSYYMLTGMPPMIPR